MLGVVDFQSAEILQERILGDVQQRDDRHGTLLICEHLSVVTLGRDASMLDLLAEPEEFTARMIPVHRVSRGGGALMHAPGQLVAYPIVPLDRCGLSVGRFRDALIQAAVSAADELKVPAYSSIGCAAEVADDHLPGAVSRCGQFAWVGADVRSGVSTHGLFLNVAPVIDQQRLVRSTPKGRGVTSLSMQKMAPVGMHTVRESLIRHLVEQLGYETFHIYTRHPLLSRTQQKVVHYV